MITYSSLLLDSGAFSIMNSDGKVKVDPLEYRDWADRFCWADARAALDDINGDYKASLRNYALDPMGFPSFHDSDPDELLEAELIPMARERGGWIGLGLTLPRQRKEHFLRSALDRMPEDLHVHAWACGAYSHLARIDSVDSTNWFMDVKYILDGAHTKHLSVGEALEIIIKRYQRTGRRGEDTEQSMPLFRAGQCG